LLHPTKNHIADLMNLALLHTPIRVRLVTDREEEHHLLKEVCRSLQHDISLDSITPARLRAELSGCLSGSHIVVLGEETTGFSNLDVLRDLRRDNLSIPIIVLSGKSNGKKAVEVMKAGATDVILKRELGAELFEKTVRFCMERLAHHHDLQLHTKLLDCLFDRSNDAMFISSKQWELILFNKPFSDLFETNAVSLGANLKNLCKSHTYEGLCNALDSGQFGDSEVSVTIQGLKKYYSMNLKHIVLSGSEEGVLGTLCDTTQGRNAERERVRNEKLQLTAHMARVLAHEVRNPLTNIRLSLDYLDDVLSKSQENRMYVDIIERNVERINALIDDLMRTAKPFEIDVHPTSIAHIIDNVLKKTKVHREQLGAEVKLHIQDNIPQWWCDSEKIELALVSLITHALEAMCKVASPVLDLGIYAESDILVLTIGDNGRGMSREVTDNLFDAFDPGGQGGVNLAMATVKNIIQGHEGYISVQSREGYGTKFEIRLPKYAL